MKKRLYVLLIVILSLIIVPLSTYGVFSLIRYINGSSSSANIDLISKNYIIHSLYDENNLENHNNVETTINASSDDLNHGYSNGKLYTYATKKTMQDRSEYHQVNQVKFEFDFNNEMDVYVRIRIEESWVSTKYYINGTVRSQVILNGDTTSENNETSELFNDSSWVYDEMSGYYYYKLKVAKGENNSCSYRFLPDFYYFGKKSTSFSESVLVTLSYDIDIVQANRAYKIWNVDVESIIGG